MKSGFVAVVATAAYLTPTIGGAAPIEAERVDQWPGVLAPADEIIEFARWNEIPDAVREKRIGAALMDELDRRPGEFVDALLNAFPSKQALVEAIKANDHETLQAMSTRLGVLVGGVAEGVPRSEAARLLNGAHRQRFGAANSAVEAGA